MASGGITECSDIAVKGGDDVDIIRQGWDDGSGSFILITDGLPEGE